MKRKRIGKGCFKKGMALCVAACLSLSGAAPVFAENALVTEETQRSPEWEAVPLEEAFPDAGFRDYVAARIDADGDGFLSGAEAEQVTELSLAGQGIASLQGVSYFANLRTLDCSDNAIAAADLSRLHKLEAFVGAGNRVSLAADADGTVDFSALPDMDYSRILEVSQGEWSGDGLLQLPQEAGQEPLAYVYDASGQAPDGESWKMEVAVDLERGGAPEEEPEAVSKDVLSENQVSENQASENAQPKEKIETVSEDEAPAEETVKEEPAAKEARAAQTSGAKAQERPAKVSLSAVTNNKSGYIQISWKKAAQAQGYEILLADNKAFTKNKRVIETTALSKSVGGMKKGQTKYVKARAYKKVSGQRVYGDYSNVKSRKITKGVTEVAAKSNSATIKSCKILSDKTQVQVKASVPKQVKSQDGYYYLFALNTGNKKLTKPVAKAYKEASVAFAFPLNYDNARNKLQSKFQVAVKAKGKYKAISAAKYISNPEMIAGVTRAFTKGKSKKGLQFGPSLPDAQSLGVNYCLFNEYITDLMKTTGRRLEYKYKGKTYYFNRDRFEALAGLYSQLQACGMNVSVEFLLPWDASQTDLIHPAARAQGAHNYYAWNVSTQAARDKYAALFSCMAEWFDGSAGRGFIDNYIIGNEVNAFDQWHYTGSSSLQNNANQYADTFQVVYMAVKSRSKNSRVSICLDHSWNVNAPGRLHSSKSFLDQFAARLKTYGSPNFTIAYHAYPIPLTGSDFWNNSPQQVKNSANSPYITMKNIQYLTKYVKSKYGSKTRIMLTEQGFSSHGTKGQQKQAAAIAYAFYKAEFNDMIDCIIFRSQADAEAEIQSDNLYMGLWTVNMGKKKTAYNVFKYMDTPQCEEKTKACRQYLGIQKWSQVATGYKVSRFKK